MSSFFEVTLDTTAPPLALEAVQGGSPGLLLVKLLSDADASEFRLWGDIQPGQPENEGFAENEGEAEWLPFDDEITVLALEQDVVNFHVQVRDEVWNAVTKTLEFSLTEAPPIQPTVPPIGQGSPERRRPARRVIESRSQITVSTSTRVKVVTAATVRLPVFARATILRGRAITGSSSFYVLSAGGVAARNRSETTTVSMVARHEVIRRRGKADDEAIVTLLL